MNEQFRNTAGKVLTPAISSLVSQYASDKM